MDVNQLKSYKAIILLNEILSNGRIFKTILEGNDYLLQPAINDMLNRGYLAVDAETNTYVATEEGETAYDNFMKRYKEYLKVYDVFCAVDTNTGEFAFEKFFDYIANSPEEEEAMYNAWTEYKNQERFFDFRIPVAIFKKIDPCELVFMSFINENRFDTTGENWQLKLLADTIWADIDNIVNTAITIEDFGGEDAMRNLINKGTTVMFSLINKELELKRTELKRYQEQQAEYVRQQEQFQAGGEEVIVEETVTVIEETETIIEKYEEDIVYYDPYYDPYYISPIWFIPLFIW